MYGQNARWYVRTKRGIFLKINAHWYERTNWFFFLQAVVRKKQGNFPKGTAKK